MSSYENVHGHRPDNGQGVDASTPPPIHKLPYMKPQPKPLPAASSGFFHMQAHPSKPHVRPQTKTPADTPKPKVMKRLGP